MGINESFPSERVHRLLAQLQAELENFILRLAAEFRRRKEQLIFLINNYDMMLGVIMVRLLTSGVTESRGTEFGERQRRVLMCAVRTEIVDGKCAALLSALANPTF